MSAEQAKLYWKDLKSGWLREILPLSAENFDRLNHELVGVPVYHNEGRVWPRCCDGIEIITHAELREANV